MIFKNVFGSRPERDDNGRADQRRLEADDRDGMQDLDQLEGISGPRSLAYKTDFDSEDDDISAGERAAMSDDDGRFDPERQKRVRLLEKINKDIDTFEENITNSEFHLKHSREQLRWFKSFTHQAELDIEDIFRLQRQKVELMSQLNHEQIRADNLQSELESERANASALENRHVEFRNALEKARGELITLVDADRAYRERIGELNRSASDRETELLEATRVADKLVAENKILKERNDRVTTDLERFMKRSTELEKNLDAAIEGNNTDREEIERLSSGLAAATDAVDNYQAENVELRSRLENSLAENAAVEKRATEKVRIREDELFSLRSRVDGLQSELRIKSEMLSQAVDEVRTAKSEAKVAKATADDLSEQLVREVQQREEHRETLLSANSEIAEVNKRFNQLIGELEQARRENEHLKRMLKVERQKLEFAVDTALASEKEARESDLLASMPDPDTTKPN